VACKKNIAQNINAFLDPIREKRAYFESRPSTIKEALNAGNEMTLRESRETIRLVREAMHFSYKDLLNGKNVIAG
jgi:tryptophanyl-tRNA synthetase